MGGDSGGQSQRLAAFGGRAGRAYGFPNFRFRLNGGRRDFFHLTPVMSHDI